MQKRAESDSSSCPLTHASYSDIADAVSSSESALHLTDSFGTGATLTSKDVAFDASTDPSLLGRAEWIKFVAAFFNRERLADEIFAQMQARFQTLASLVDESIDEDARPVVAFVSFNAGYSYGDVVVPDSWSISAPDYVDDLTFSAGALQPIGIENEDSASFSTVDEVKLAIDGVDVIIDLTYAYDPLSYDYNSFLENFDLSNETDVVKFPFLENKLVFRTDKVRVMLTSRTWCKKLAVCMLETFVRRIHAMARR